MSILRKFSQLAFITAFISLLICLHKLNTHGLAKGRHGTQMGHEDASSTSATVLSPPDTPYHKLRGHPIAPFAPFSTKFRYGTPKPPGSSYSRTIVVPRLMNDDTSWIEDELPGMDTAIYIANDPTAALHPPTNKGHEVMIYLTYIIDHYFNLPDIIIFMHAHRWTHHNLELLGYDSAEMVRRLSNDYVARQGYVNMRCRWYPGCPEWLHPGDTQEVLAKQEAVVLSNCWRELFPSDPLPEALGQGCCAQFAVSKNRVLSIPLSRFVFYRDWILKTPLSDYVSGRIWEYLWQFLFTGRTVYCPSEHACHCFGFGVCFGGDAQYQEFEEIRRSKETYELELKELRERQGPIDGGREGSFNLTGLELMDRARYSNLTLLIAAFEREMRARHYEALEQGSVLSNRVKLSGERGSRRVDF